MQSEAIPPQRPQPSDAPRRNRREKYARQLILVLAVVVVLVQWAHLLDKPRGDFPNHWISGQRFVAGEFIYEGGHNYPYPPFWAMAHGALCLVAVQPAQVLCFPLFLVALAALLWVLKRLARNQLPVDAAMEFWVAAAAIALASRFLLRDMVECGVNLALVALSWMAVYWWTRHREWLGGSCLGLAIALKCTPAAFLAYFLWKRQWKMALATTTAAAAFTLLPMLWMGPVQFGRTMDFWLSHAARGAGGSNPSVGVLGDESAYNISLRPRMARYLMHLPDTHLGHLEQEGYFEFLDLPPPTAGLIIKAFMIALALAVAWTFRRAVPRRDDEAIVWQCAAISLAILLYSPITWGQHCVGVLPALYLLVRTAYSRGRLPGWIGGILGAYIFLVLLLNRGLVGRSIAVLLQSYGTHTWSILALLAATLGCHWRVVRGRGNEPRDETQQGVGRFGRAA